MKNLKKVLKEASYMWNFWVGILMILLSIHGIHNPYSYAALLAVLLSTYDCYIARRDMKFLQKYMPKPPKETTESFV